MWRVALTGGIATGKSYVRAAVAGRGVPTIDSDRIVHELLARGTDTTAAVEARFGPAVIHADGAVDRSALGRLVFSDAAARADLERIIHPSVYERIFAWAAEQEARGARWALADVPLLFETGRQAAFDRVVVAACDPELQVRRVVARNGVSESDARARLAAQWPIAEKVRLADYVITTDGSFAETDGQIAGFVAGMDRLG